MKHFKKTIAILFGINLWIITLLTVLQITAFDTAFYHEQYLKLDTANYIAVSEADLMKATEVLLDYTSGKRDNLDITVQIDSVMSPYFNQKEIDHMVDVRNLYLGFINLRNGLVVFNLLLFAFLWFKAKEDIVHLLYSGFKYASLGVGLAVIGILAYAIIDFEHFWTTFHHLLFTNELWLLDPNTDNLIKMVPEEFFISLIFTIITRFLFILGVIYTTLHALKFKGLSSRALKLIAVITMLVDHLGHYLFPDMNELRIIGRIAYPIFTYMFALSYIYTHSKKDLLIRVAITAVVTQVLLYFSGTRDFVNIFFLFTLAWVTFKAIDKNYYWFIILTAITAEYFQIDYGMYGILTLSAFYIFRDKKWIQMSLFALLTLYASFYFLLDPKYSQYIKVLIDQPWYSLTHYFIQFFAIFTIIPLLLYNNRRAEKVYPKWVNDTEKYFYYAFYPVHLVILGLIRG